MYRYFELRIFKFVQKPHPTTHQAPSTIKGRGAVIRGATVMANLLQICEQNAVLGVPPLYWRRDLRTTITRWLMPGFERVLSPR